jgi:hypothetical protein
MNTSIDTYTNEPSLLKQIVDEVDTLDDEGKLEILRKVKLQKALTLAKLFDQQLQGKFIEASEDDITNAVSENRQKWQNEKLSD